jgi:hypothetical protein
MTERETIDARLARIEERLKVITSYIERQIVCRHVTRDGECDFYQIVVDTQRTRNQWTGALAAVAALCSFIGSIIAFIVMKVVR